MASIRKRGKKWFAEVRAKGHYQAKSFASKLEARAWTVDQEQYLNTYSHLIRGKTVVDACERYGDEILPLKRGGRAEKNRLLRLQRADFASIFLMDLKVDDLNQWKDNELKRVKPSSVNRDLNLLSSVIEAARKQWKWTESNPVREVDRPKNPPPRDRRISQDEINLILDALNYNEDDEVATQTQEVAIAFLFALETAMRQGEIWKLEWDRICLDHQFLTLNETKNGTKRDVPLSSKAVALLQKLSPKQQGLVFRFAQDSSGTIFRRALKMAGIEGLTFHDTRHEALTRLARKLDVLDLARMVGHRDPRSLMIYYNATASEIAQRLD